MKKDIDDHRRDREAAAQAMETAADALSDLEAAEAPDEAALAAAQAEFDAAESDFAAADKRVKRAESVEAAKAKAATAGDEDQTAGAGTGSVPAQAKNPEHKGIEVGFMIAALANNKGNREAAVAQLDRDGFSGIGAIMTGATESAGGITIPQAQSSDLIEMLRPRVTVRASGARTVPMPAGELRDARQTGSATASYGAEAAPAVESEQTFDAVDKSFKKLTSLVPLSNSLIRHSSIAMAVVARDDMLKVMAAREDIGFLRNDGTGDLVKGLRSWCPVGNWQTGVGVSVAAIDVALRKCVDVVEDADVAMTRGGWIMRASTKNFLASLKDANGNLLYPSIESNGQLRGYPIRTSSQIPNNLGVGSDETEIYFADFDEVVIGDAMAITIATSDQASFVDQGGTTISAFQRDLTLMRAVSEHDLAPRHDEALSGITAAGWSL